LLFERACKSRLYLDKGVAIQPSSNGRPLETGAGSTMPFVLLMVINVAASPPLLSSPNSWNGSRWK
jgi:hypothetical protein